MQGWIQLGSKGIGGARSRAQRSRPSGQEREAQRLLGETERRKRCRWCSCSGWRSPANAAGPELAAAMRGARCRSRTSAYPRLSGTVPNLLAVRRNGCCAQLHVIYPPRGPPVAEHPMAKTRASGRHTARPGRRHRRRSGDRPIASGTGSGHAGPSRRAATAGAWEHPRLQRIARRRAQAPGGATKGRCLRVPRLSALRASG